MAGRNARSKNAANYQVLQLAQVPHENRRQTGRSPSNHEYVSIVLVAVGTIIADRPPHRSVRAGLPHTAPTLDE